MKKPVKVNPFDPIEPGLTMETYDDGAIKRKSLGVPVRLMMATQLATGLISKMEKPSDAVHVAPAAFELADALIAYHNKAVEKINEEKDKKTTAD